MINPDQIAAAYDELADYWNGDGFDRGNGIEQHRRAFAMCKNRRTALDVGCGSSGRLIDLMQQQGFAVEGLDLSARMLELARRRHPEVTFHHADICVWQPALQYDFISAWDSIWHVPLADQASVMHKLFNCLKPEGICIFTMGGMYTPDEKVDDAMGPQMYYSTLGIPKTLELVGDSDCLCRHLEYDQYPEPHVYMIVQKLT